MSTLTPDIATRLTRLGAATIYEAQGKRGAIDERIRAIDPARTLVGRALTVDVGPADNLMLHAALLQASPGDVIVADARGFLQAGAWGDVLTAAAQHVGVAGLVIDGAVRDADEIRRMGFPVFARGLSIRGTGKTYRGAIGGPITLAGTPVRTGDIIVGDRDGLVVIAEGDLDDSLARAEQRERTETRFRDEIGRGISTAALLDLEETLERYGLLPASSR